LSYAGFLFLSGLSVALYTKLDLFMFKLLGGTAVQAGIYGAAFLSNAWYPASRANATHALLRGTTALSATVGWNVLREFWPDIKNSLHRRHETEP